MVTRDHDRKVVIRIFCILYSDNTEQQQVDAESVNSGENGKDKYLVS